MSLPPDVQASYSSRIDSILATSDLQTVTAKSIRKALQEGLDHDITSQKNAVTALIRDRFDKYTAEQEAKTGKLIPSAEPAPTVNGVKSPEKNGIATASSPDPPSTKHNADSEEPSEVEDRPPAKKKAKRTAEVDGDAAFAAKLQAEENSRARPTRGGNTRKRAPVKKKTSSPKKKSSNKVKADDDSELDSESGDEKAKKRSGAFHKPMYLSPPLADLLGESQMSRPQTVKGIWEYVRSHELQNPDDKRQIMCDDALRAIFKKDTVHMFTMNKILSDHLTAVDES